MKLLHTSDWHVGKALRGRSRADEHRAVLAEITAIARHEAVDAVLVGGDLFDTATPSAEAEDIVYRALLDLAATGAEVVVIGGNHDNARRLEAVAPLLSLAGIRVLAHPSRPGDGGVVALETRSGERLRLALLPFPPQRYVVRAEELLGADAVEHRVDYQEFVKALVEMLTAGLDAGAVNVLMGHLTIVGASAGGGERIAQTVFDYCVPATIFPAALHYVALGHLHRCQQIPAPCPVWYCGSPLQLDFGETEDPKSVVLVEAAAGTPAEAREVRLTEGRRLRTIEKTMAGLGEMEGTTGDDFLRIRIAEAHRAGLADEVRALFPDAVDVVIKDPAATEAPSREAVSREGRPPHELFSAYLDERHESDPAVLALFDELLEETGAAAAS